MPAGALSLALALVATAAHAGNGFWSLQLDDDEFAGFSRHDRWYSAGWRLDRLLPVAADGLARTMQDRWCALQACDPDLQGLTRWSVGQNIYTQDLRNRGETDLLDRPVAAWLHLSGALLLSGRDETRMLAALIGLTGPAALGEPLQNGLHRLMGATRVTGWDNQLRPRLGLQLQWLQANRWPLARSLPGMPGTEADLITQAQAVLGNLSRHAGIGLSIRLGRGLQGTWLPTEAQQATGVVDAGEHWSVQAGGTLRGVQAERLIDGPVFGNAQQLRAAHRLSELHLAFTAAPAPHWRVRFALIHRSVEFESAATANGQFHPQRFGVLQFGRRLD